MRVWGVTGTNGKTSVTWILAEFLRAAYVTTVEVNTRARRFSTGYTTPPLDQLKNIFAEMEAAGAQDCVMEVSSHAIHQNRVGFGEVTTFAGGAFTNLSEDHLDYHKTMEEYFRVKLSFAERIAAAHRDGSPYQNDACHGRVGSPSRPPQLGRRDLPPFVVCLDGGYGREMLDAVGRLPLNVIPVTRARPRFDLSGLKLVGDYNESNVLVAAALAEAAGVPHDEIQRIIPALTPRWGRLERVVNPNVAADVYVDFAHTPDGLEKVLAAARGFTKGKLWVVFGAGGDRDPMKRPLMGAACAKLADRLVVTSDNPRSEDPAAIIAAIMAGVGDKGGVTVEPDRARAIRFALANAAEGDVMIVAGKGHETTQEIAGVKHPFDDREVVRNF